MNSPTESSSPVRRSPGSLGPVFGATRAGRGQAGQRAQEPTNPGTNGAQGSRARAPGQLTIGQTAATSSYSGAPERVLPPTEWGTGLGVAPKFNLTTKEATSAFGSPRLFQRLRHHGWIKALPSLRDALYPMSQLVEVQQRLQRGEMPPLLPSEARRKVDDAKLAATTLA